MTELSFANKLYAHLAEGITSGQTTIPIVPGDMGNIWAGFKPGVYLYLVIMNELGQKEIVKVTGVNKNNMLTVQRGQGGTTARAFAIGSPITERTIAEQASYMIQRGIFRQGNYNPNTILTGEFNGEKFWQTGPAANQKRWWINAGGGDRWRLMSGDLYGYEYRDSEGFIIAPPQWAEVAPMYGGTEYDVRPILVYGSDVFGVSSQYWPHANGGKLLMWNGMDAWVEKAPKLGFADSLGLCQHGAELFACTDTGILQKWNGVNLWVSVIGVPHVQSFTYIYSYGSHLYAVDTLGAIKIWNDLNGWAADPPQVPFGMYIGGNGVSVVEIGGSIFAQGNRSAIYEWDGGAMWLEDIPAIGFNILNILPVCCSCNVALHEKYLLHKRQRKAILAE